MGTTVADDAGRRAWGGGQGGRGRPTAGPGGQDAGRPGAGGSVSRVTAAPRRRSVPHLVAGALLVVVCAVGAVVAAGQLGGRESVLALARAVAAGQVLAGGDVRAVEVAAGTELDLLPAASVSAVVGRSVAYALPAGSLLTRAALGPAQVPAEGEAVAAVGLRAGQFPPQLQPGARVAVLVSAGTEQAPAGAAGGPAAGASWTGVVVAVEPGGGEQTTVVSLRLSEPDARAVAAAAAGRVAVVVLGGGG